MSASNFVTTAFETGMPDPMFLAGSDLRDPAAQVAPRDLKATALRVKNWKRGAGQRETD